MLCLLVLLIWRLIYIWIPGRCVKFNQADFLLKNRTANQKSGNFAQPMREIFCTFISWNPVAVGISKKRRLSQKSKVSTVHIEIRRLGLRVSKQKFPALFAQTLHLFLGRYISERMILPRWWLINQLYSPSLQLLR